MDTFERIAGTFGVPVAILAAVLWWILIPISKAYVANLNKVGDALAPMKDSLKSIDENQARIADQLESVCHAECPQR